MHPNFSEEKKLWRQGYECVVGLDEAGRGPLAGPVVAAAVRCASDCRINIPINDSKKISEKQRENFYKILTNHPAISWGIGVVSEKLIDEVNILEASKLAMKNALEHLYCKIRNCEKYGIGHYLLIDGNFLLRGLDIAQKAIVKGDQKVFSISAAGIIAKVTRDKIMGELHNKYPQYGFLQHKGYGTALHINNLKNFGPSKIHRKTFWPVSSYSHIA